MAGRTEGNEEKVKRYILSVLLIGEKLGGSSYEPRGIAEATNLMYGTRLTESGVRDILDEMWESQQSGLARFPCDSSRAWRGNSYRLMSPKDLKVKPMPARRGKRD